MNKKILFTVAFASLALAGCNTTIINGGSSSSAGGGSGSNPSSSEVPSTVSSEEPTTSSEEPTTSSEEPTTSSEEPTTSSEEPTPSSSDPTPSSEDPTPSSEEPISTYTVTFKNWDDLILASVSVKEGETAVYPHEDPTRESTAQHSFAFTGWDMDLTNVTFSFETVAQYKETVNQYTVSFLNEDGTVLQTGKWDYGVTPDYSGETPTKAATAEYTYTFSGWTPEVTPVTGDAIYTATFSETLNHYTVTFKDYDGTVLQTGKWSYGATPSYSGDTPTKASTAEHSYAFSGWSPEIASVTEDATYTAQYAETVNQYTVKFVNYDGTVLQTSYWDYGATPTYSGATPTKGATAEHSYFFKGWSPEISSVIGDATYTAQYTETVNQYTVSFVNEDGTVLQESEWAYGAIPTYSGETPTKKATAQYTYEFTGWSPVVSSVIGDATYTATFAEIVNQYTVVFEDYDGTVLESGKWAYGATPAYSGEDPVRAPTAQYAYAFSGWDSEISPVTGDATYTAQYTETVNKYTVTFKNYDGTVLEKAELDYGSTPTYSGATPIKESTAEYTYTFSGWDSPISTVTGDATYTAQYTETVNKYTVTFKNYDGTVLQESEWDYGSTPTYSGATPIRESTAEYTYTFSGWDSPISTVTGDATYTAAYTSEKIVYSITYDLDGGVLSEENASTYSKGDTLTLNSPARSGYTFAGWYLGGDPFESGSTLDVTGNITITAKWTANTYVATLDPNNGCEAYTVNFSYGSTYELSAPATAPTGYSTFEGWYLGGEAIPSSGVWSIAEDVALTAKWAPNTYTVTLEYENGADSETKEVTYGSSYELGEPAVENGDYFAGWYNGEDIVSSSGVWDIADDVTLTARYGCYYEFELNSDGTAYSVSGFDESYAPADLAIPSTYNGLPVTAISAGVFSECSSITSVVVPDSVTSIGRLAFYKCENLSSITLPSGIKEVPYAIFYGCSSLTSVNIPDAVTSIGQYAFLGCGKLSSVALPSALTVISAYAFYGCSSLTSIEIPEAVTAINDYAFEGCSSLASINIPSGVTSLGVSTFEDCTKLTSVTLPDGFKEVPIGIFEGCSSLTSVDIPDSVTVIRSSAFEGCSSLASINIPSGVTSLGGYAFKDCKKLSSIALPSGITRIGTYTFYGCSSLTSIVIPDAVTSIGYWAFSYCTNLASVNIPSGVEEISEAAFLLCRALTSIDLPDSITSINRNAFAGCSSLTSIVIPDAVTSIGYYAFGECSKLASVTLGDNIQTIGNSAFAQCPSLTSLVLPSSVTSIGKNAFSKCVKLNEIFYKGTAAEWENVSVGDQALASGTVYYYSDSEPTESGNYWHYDANGNIVIWAQA